MQAQIPADTNWVAVPAGLLESLDDLFALFSLNVVATAKPVTQKQSVWMEVQSHQPDVRDNRREGFRSAQVRRIDPVPAWAQQPGWRTIRNQEGLAWNPADLGKGIPI